VNRSVLLIVLLGGYAAVLGRGAVDRALGRRGFDPLAPQPSAVEQLIVAGRFADARPLALELCASFPDEPAVWWWLATIDHHLPRSADEAEAWTHYMHTSAAPAEACPAWPDALAKSGDTTAAQAARARCQILLHP
jgi:hypothetical protein